MNTIDAGLKFNGALTKRTKTDYIVIHHPAAVSASVEQIHQWHLNKGWAGIGYNLYIRKNGLIYKGRGIEYVGAHAAPYNTNSVAVCCEGDFQSTDTFMSNVQKESVIEVVKELKRIYPNAQIVGHRDLNATSCPGKYFPMDEIINKIFEEGLTMSQYAELDERLKKLEGKKIYNKIEDMPDWARTAIQKAVENGYLTGVDEEGNLNLTYEELRNYTVDYRKGDFDSPAIH